MTHESDGLERYMPDDEDLLIDRLIQHSPGVDHALRVLQKAQNLDHWLRLGEGGIHPLTRRFVIFSGGSDNHPFLHYRVLLKPKSRGIPMGLSEVVLRFGVQKNDEHKSFSGVVSVTEVGESTTDYILDDKSCESYTSIDELVIRDGVLVGVADPRHDSAFDAGEFADIMNEMEPELQTNSVLK